MKRITLVEYQRLRRTELTPKQLSALQRLDDSHVGSRSTAFDWSRREYLVAQNRVGVLQVPGLQIEILPKIDRDHTSSDTEAVNRRAQRNLLYMLYVAGEISYEARDLAAQEQKRSPLFEALVAMFADRLMRELRRGIHRTYVRVEDELAVVRGRLLLQRQIQTSMGRMEKQHVAYDDFISDNPINQILKAACMALLPVVGSAQTLTRLREALVELEDVSDVEIRSHDFDRLLLDRTTERFDLLLKFAEMVLAQRSLSMSAGGFRMFSLLFPMETVFEGFIGRLIQRHAGELGLERSRIHLQAKRRRRWLLRDQEQKGKFRLIPDILLNDVAGDAGCIIDTKWKRLLSDEEDKKNGVSQSDLYQLYAYAARYQCPRCILLYPRIDGVTEKAYRPDGDVLDSVLGVGFVDLNRDLPKELHCLLSDIKSLLALGTNQEQHDMITV